MTEEKSDIVKETIVWQVYQAKFSEWSMTAAMIPNGNPALLS